MGDPRAWERLGEIAGLPADHPDRVAFEADPRRRALLHEYRAFLEAAPAPGSRPEEARAALDVVLARERDRPRSPSARRSRTRRPGYRRALIAVAAVVILGFGVRFQLDRPRDPSGVQRGQTAAAFRALRAEVERDRVVLHWTRHPDATRYEVVVYAADSTEIHRTEAIADTTIWLDRGRLGGTEPAAWRVVGWLGPDEIARSPLEPLAF